MINSVKFVLRLLVELATILGYVALQGRGRDRERPASVPPAPPVTLRSVA